MLIFGNSQKYPEFPDDSEESFIVENLSPYCVLWLSRQSEALGETRTVILQKILKECFAMHAQDVPKNLDEYVVDIARDAVSEFILRHQEEFLPIHRTYRRGFVSKSWGGSAMGAVISEQ